VLIDIRECRPPGTGDVAAVINATANKVPRQQ
jgi:serine/threonine-protein kinase